MDLPVQTIVTLTLGDDLGMRWCGVALNTQMTHT
jgi:hypothetical protein